MLLADNHVHTAYSSDGHGTPEQRIEAALALGLTHLSFTEHVDFLYPKPEFAHGDIPAYFAELRALQRKYAPRIYINVGVELGYTAANTDMNVALIDEYRPDYVINSVHVVDGADCYFPDYFANRTPAEAVERYLCAVRASLDAPYPYHTVGHLGYVLRNAPFDIVSLCDIAPALTDDILRTVIVKQKILELNTSCRKEILGSIPTRDVLSRYAALGGKKICFSSDAHYDEHLGRNYPFARELVRAVGFTHQTVIENGKEISLLF